MFEDPRSMEDPRRCGDQTLRAALTSRHVPIPQTLTRQELESLYIRHVTKTEVAAEPTSIVKPGSPIGGNFTTSKGAVPTSISAEPSNRRHSLYGATRFHSDKGTSGGEGACSPHPPAGGAAVHRCSGCEQLCTVADRAVQELEELKRCHQEAYGNADEILRAATLAVHILDQYQAAITNHQQNIGDALKSLLNLCSNCDVTHAVGRGMMNIRGLNLEAEMRARQDLQAQVQKVSQGLRATKSRSPFRGLEQQARSEQEARRKQREHRKIVLASLDELRTAISSAGSDESSDDDAPKEDDMTPTSFKAGKATPSPLPDPNFSASGDRAALSVQQGLGAWPSTLLNIGLGSRGNERAGMTAGGSHTGRSLSNPTPVTKHGAGEAERDQRGSAAESAAVGSSKEHGAEREQDDTGYKASRTGEKNWI